MIALLVLAAASVANVPPGVLDFRGAYLGMNFVEFKKLSEFQNIKCHTEQLPGYVDPVTKCLKSRFNLEPFSGATAESFNFLLDDKKDLRLATIDILTAYANASDVKRGLLQKFGEGKTSTDVVQNRFGSEFSHDSTIWHGTPESQTVELSFPCSNIEEMCLSYSDSAMLKYSALRVPSEHGSSKY